MEADGGVVLSSADATPAINLAAAIAAGRPIVEVVAELPAAGKDR
jgi:hypothetical protein